MYLWNIHAVVERLRKNQISPREALFYYSMSPLLSLFNTASYATMLGAHQVIALQFADILSKSDVNMSFYNKWGVAMALITGLFTGWGWLSCYLVNKHGDNKNLVQRMAALSFPINFHLTFYSLLFLAIVFTGLYWFYRLKIAAFQDHIFCSTGNVEDVLMQAVPKGFAQECIKMVAQKSNTVKSALKLPAIAAKLPMLPFKIKSFATKLRTMVLMWYPYLALVPPVHTLLNYMWVRNMLKQVNQK